MREVRVSGRGLQLSNGPSFPGAEGLPGHGTLRGEMGPSLPDWDESVTVSSVV